MSLAQATNLHKRFGKAVALEEFTLTPFCGRLPALSDPIPVRSS